ncbi:ankyrin repeat and SOCS box protein 5 isoform X3 [Channa argus]|uniref:ankyrin repeat and SOCS box protein 5 isoform X3 n=1 Tax=Channa argus TaxID=215402 RepID=UPI0035219C85
MRMISYFSFISSIATYKSSTVHSILKEDAVGWQLFFSHVLIEHSHDTPLPFPSLPQPPSCPSFHSQLCCAPFHSQTATKTTHSQGQAVRRQILGEERHDDNIIWSWADRSPLHDAASQGRLLALKTLILQVNASTVDGVTPLFNACTVGSVACTEILLENGAKPQSLVYRPSPIHEATSKGHYGCVEALVTWGADVDMDIPHLGTALYTACVCQELECARKLLREGANVQKGKSLDSPLHAAAEKDCTAVVKLLLDFGADINARNTEFQRPVDVAPASSLTEGFLLLYEATPRLLSQLCRQCIRSCVGRDRLHLLSHLPLPNRLRNYLQYQ